MNLLKTPTSLLTTDGPQFGRLSNLGLQMSWIDYSKNLTPPGPIAGSHVLVSPCNRNIHYLFQNKIKYIMHHLLLIAFTTMDWVLCIKCMSLGIWCCTMPILRQGTLLLYLVLGQVRLFGCSNFLLTNMAADVQL